MLYLYHFFNESKGKKEASMKDEPELVDCVHGNLGLVIFKDGEFVWVQKPHCPICNPEEEEYIDDLIDDGLSEI